MLSLPSGSSGCSRYSSVSSPQRSSVRVRHCSASGSAAVVPYSSLTSASPTTSNRCSSSHDTSATSLASGSDQFRQLPGGERNAFSRFSTICSASCSASRSRCSSGLSGNQEKAHVSDIATRAPTSTPAISARVRARGAVADDGRSDSVDIDSIMPFPPRGRRRVIKVITRRLAVRECSVTEQNENSPGGEQAHGGEPPRGSMRFQDAENTAPRQPSLAEQRARRQAEAERQQREIEQAEAAGKAESRRRLLIGSGVAAGLVGFIAGFYVVAVPEEVTAHCVDENGTIVDDDYCDDDYASNHGGYYHSSSNIVFLPSPGGGDDYRQYRYNYGGTGSIGDTVRGGSFSRPSNAEIKTNSGRTVQRGGFGVSSGSFGKGGGS